MYLCNAHGREAGVVCWLCVSRLAEYPQCRESSRQASVFRERDSRYLRTVHHQLDGGQHIPVNPARRTGVQYVFTRKRRAARNW